METTMFNVQAKHPATPTNLVFNNIIGAGSFIQGDQIIKGHLLISGECIGNLKFDLATEDTAVVDLNGVMRGDITCKNAIVIGRVEGNLRVENRLEIYPSAIVNGDIDYVKYLFMRMLVSTANCTAYWMMLSLCKQPPNLSP
ncbi:MAG: polymer-forming cytoskeletal protein [Burkholderiaceae bacterium]|nr:polymer-forming cytoskeletal protein [Burkholderiaceae bacterium]